MTALRADESVPYFLTQAGMDAIQANRELMTAREAAEVIGMPREAVCTHARCGFIEGTKVEGFWLLERASVLRLRDERATGKVQRAHRQSRPGSGVMGARQPHQDGAGTARFRTSKRYLPAEPLLRLVDSLGGPAACGVRKGSAEERALCRARASGRLTERAAERLVIGVLGLAPMEVWG